MKKIISSLISTWYSILTKRFTENSWLLRKWKTFSLLNQKIIRKFWILWRIQSMSMRPLTWRKSRKNSRNSTGSVLTLKPNHNSSLSLISLAMFLSSPKHIKTNLILEIPSIMPITSQSWNKTPLKKKPWYPCKNTTSRNNSIIWL